MACRNGEKTLRQALKSMQRQTFPDWELIFVDDGSVDASLEIGREFASKDPRFVIIRNTESGRGVWFVRNLGIEAAQGRFIAFLDCDDYLIEDSLYRRLEVIERTGYSSVFGSYLRLKQDGTTSKREPKTKVSYSSMLMKNYIANLTGMYDTTKIGKIYQREFGHEDYLMWLEVLKSGGKCISAGPYPLAVYRVMPGSLSSNKFKALRWRWAIFKRGLGLPMPTAAICMAAAILNACKDAFFDFFWSEADNETLWECREEEKYARISPQKSGR